MASIIVGGRAMSPRRVLVAVLAVCGIAAGISLGLWQWGRAAQKTGLHAAQQARAALPPLGAEALQMPLQEVLHRRVVLRGEWVEPATVYLDNRQMQGRPGFYVVTPLRLSRGTAVLVQRGWIPRDFQDRTRLQPVDTPRGEVTVEGRLAPPPARLYATVEGERGAIRQNLDPAAFRAETGLPLASVSVVELGAASQGLQRNWPQAATGAEKNTGYAFQWWALAGLIALLYVWFELIPRRGARAS